jgi:hypothetical protein
MESIAATYGLPFNEFNTLLWSSSYLLSGSSALAGFMEQEGVAPSFTPNDLDIFVTGPIGVEAATDRSFLCHPVTNEMSTFLLRSGYQLCDPASMESKLDSDPYEKAITRIQRVFHYHHPLHHTHIQLIMVNTMDLHTYLLKNVDLSVCMVWYEAVTDGFIAVYGEDILAHRMKRNMLVTIASSHAEDRIAKYITRGFRMEYAVPPKTNLARDEREILFTDQPWQLRGQTAFDCVAYEDVSIHDFLKESPWNIVLKAGETYYAFHRTQLIEFMEKRHTKIEGQGMIYETPYNQTLNETQMELLKYCDFSIYELQHAYDMTIQRGASTMEKAMYHMECYSISNREKPILRMTVWAFPEERDVEEENADDE